MRGFYRFFFFSRHPGTWFAALKGFPGHRDQCYKITLVLAGGLLCRKLLRIFKDCFPSGITAVNEPFKT